MSTSGRRRAASFAFALLGLLSVSGLPCLGTPTAPASDATVTWRGAAGDGVWSNPANWDRGRVPRPTDTARFDSRSPDATLDVPLAAPLDATTAGAIAGLRLETGYRGTVRLGGKLFDVTGTTTVLGGLLLTPQGTLRTRALDLRAPGCVRLPSHGRLEVTGDGAPLGGDGLLDTTTNLPNSVQLTGRVTTDLSRSGPAWAFRVLGKPAAVAAHAQPPASPTGGSTPDTWLHLPSGEGSASAAVLDAATGFAYFGTDASPGVIVKVRLSDLSRVGTLTLGLLDREIRSAALDAVAGFAYFGTESGKVVRVRLSDFTIAGWLEPDQGRSAVTAAIVDPAGGFAYFGTWDGRVARVRLSDFSKAGILSLASDETRLASPMIDPASGFAYFCSAYSVVKIRLSDFRRVSATRLPGLISGAALDPVAGIAYVMARYEVKKLRVSDLVVTDTLALPGSNGYGPVVLDQARQRVYVASFAYYDPAQVLDVRLSDFTVAGTVTLQAGEDQLSCALLDPASGLAYFGGGGFVSSANGPFPSGSVVSLRLSDLTRIGSLRLFPGLAGLRSAAIDSEFVYFGASVTPGIVAKIRLSDFTLVGVLTLALEDQLLASAALDRDAGMLYLGTDTIPGRVVKIRLSDFTRVAALTLPRTDSWLHSAFLDAAGGFLYFGTKGNPGGVSKIRLSDFERVGSLVFPTGEDQVTAAVFDPSTGYGYFGVTSPPSVVKVRLSDLTRVASLPLPGSIPTCAVIDLAGGLAYFGTAGPGPSGIARIRLSDFSQTGWLPTGARSSAVLIPGSGFAHFGGARVVDRVSLDGFTIAGTVGLHTPYADLTSAVADPAAGFVYFGAWASPGFVSRLDIGNRAPTTTTLTGSPNPSASGQPVTFTASVDASPPATLNGGTVQFEVDYAQIGPPVPVVDGRAVVTTTDLPPGGHFIVATYSGTAVYGASRASLAAGQIVTSRDVAVLMTSSPNPSRAGRPVDYAVTLQPRSSDGFATGTIQLRWEGGNLGPPVPVSGYTTIIGNQDLPAGRQVVTAAYSGDSRFDPASGTLPVEQTVQENPALSFYTLFPCRAADTRSGPPVPPGTDRHLSLASACGIPGDALAVSLNVTVTNPTASGYLTIHPEESAPPLASTLNFRPGQTRASNSIVPLFPYRPSILVLNGSPGTVDVILDVNGYFQ